VLAGRYRVIGLLGRGGMGEVYRADDLKLGTPVALKFLPRGLADDPVKRERFFAEVRIARQIAHPNVCRVFDIGETSGAGGQHFLTNAIVNGIFAVLVVRVGLLAAVTAFYVSGLFVFFPVTANLRAWHAGAGVTALLVLASLALFGFTTALAGRPRSARPCSKNDDRVRYFSL